MFSRTSQTRPSDAILLALAICAAVVSLWGVTALAQCSGGGSGYCYLDDAQPPCPSGYCIPVTDPVVCNIDTETYALFGGFFSVFSWGECQTDGNPEDHCVCEQSECSFATYYEDSLMEECVNECPDAPTMIYGSNVDYGQSIMCY